MPHDIIDNRREQLVSHIRRILSSTELARFAVGYFFLPGLESVAADLDSLSELRLLIGNTSSARTMEQIASRSGRLEYAQREAEAVSHPRRADMEQATLEAARNVGYSAALMDQTDEAQALVNDLVRFIEEGRLKVRVYTRGRLHAKAYIFDYGQIYDERGTPVPREESGIAVVGSSNLTLAGITSNTELNVLVHGNANHAELTQWFDELWSESEEFEPHLLRELRNSWPVAQVTPYEVYLKILYELVRDQLEGEEAAEFLWRDEITGVLTEFQERAVRQAVQMVRRHGGCFVADVVGLGKSYIGAAVIKHFERHDRARPLIICPAALVEMWEHYNEAYQLNARVLSMGMLREDERDGPEWMLHDERYRYRDFVLVDESHNFRNTDTQRYRVLQTFLASGDRRSVFLTATPRNKTVWDIYHQMRLFHQQDSTYLPVDPPHLRKYFRLVEDGQRRLPELLAHVLIRRTRNHILRWYGYDAETNHRVDPDYFAPYRDGSRRAYVLVGEHKQFFPKRSLRTVEYSVEATYRGLYGQLRDHLGRPRAPGRTAEPDQLTYARYGLWNYVRPDKRRSPPYAELKRAGVNLRGLMRIMLFKRFESSVAAFRETVGRLLRIHEQFLVALDQGIVPAGEEAQRLLYESDLDEEQALMDALAKISGRYALDDFKGDALRADIDHDRHTLQKMLDLVEPIHPDEDAKLQTLKRCLGQAPLNEGKVLIFTQYADTAKYLYENVHPEDSRLELEVVFSREKSKADIVGRFAPRANPEHRPVHPAPEIDMLISTDVLAEGLNLQDCAQVINYDLHWNPVRLIQRLGRVDRIGTEHDVIYAYNFLPETELEKNLHLRDKLSLRIREIHETMGEDAAILDPTEQLNEEAMYTIYAEGEIGLYEEDDVDDFIDLHEAQETIRQLREDDPELYSRIIELRDGIRCGRAGAGSGAVVLCRAGQYRDLLLVDDDGDIISRDVPRVLNLLRCDPDTPSLPLPPGYNRLVTKVKEQFDRQVAARRAEREHTLSLTRAQRHVLTELRVLYGQERDEDLRHQIAQVESAFRRPDPRPAVRSELNRVRRDGLTGMALLDAVSRIYHLYGLHSEAPRAEVPTEEEYEASRIVCSQALRQ